MRERNKNPSKRLFLILVCSLTFFGVVGLIFSLTGNRSSERGGMPTIEDEANVSVIVPVNTMNQKGTGENFALSNHFDSLTGAVSAGENITEGGNADNSIGWLNVQELDGDSVLNYGKKSSNALIRIDGTTTDEKPYYTFETDFRFDGTTSTETTKGDSSSWMLAFHLANDETRSTYIEEKFFSLFFVGELSSDRYFVSTGYKMATLLNKYFLRVGNWYNLRVEYYDGGSYRVYVNDTLIESGYYPTGNEQGNDNSFAKVYVELRHYVPDLNLYLDNTYISKK